MPRVLDQIHDARGLLEMARIAVQSAETAFQSADDPFYGMDYGYRMHEYNQLVSAAARIVGREVSLLFRPYDLSMFPSPFALDRVCRRMHLLHVTRNLSSLAAFLETKAESEPTIISQPVHKTTMPDSC